MRHWVAVFFSLPLLSGIVWAKPPLLTIVKPTAVFQGGIAELKVSGRDLAAVEGRIGNEKISFYPSGGAFDAIVGIDLEAKPGPAGIEIQGVTSAGERGKAEIVLQVKAKSFPRENFSVAPAFDQLTPDVLDRIRREREEFDRVFSVSAPVRLWQAPFLVPVPMIGVSSAFGYRRVINGTPRAPHTGVDLRAPSGTEVLAANNGQVVLVGDFFFSGKSVVVDHGGGLYTLYFHFSDFKVAQGAEVRKGDVLGLSGMTGRVTGPHLHWSARLNGARIDPFQLIEELGGTENRTADADESERRDER